MRTFKSKGGPFAEQPFFEPAEIERTCSDELRKLALYPDHPSPVRIDRFIEKRFRVQPSYADLPSGLLGFTRFGLNGVEEIVVSKSLDDEGTTVAERRLRTTLAHEAGHGLLHAYLFALGERPQSLFGESLAEDSPKILCRDDGSIGDKIPARKPPYRWYEYQANLAMGSLLLPHSLVEESLAPFLVATGQLGARLLPEEGRERAIRHVAEAFDVNPVVARIRLDGMFPESIGRQLTL